MSFAIQKKIMHEFCSLAALGHRKNKHFLNNDIFYLFMFFFFTDVIVVTATQWCVCLQSNLEHNIKYMGYKMQIKDNILSVNMTVFFKTPSSSADRDQNSAYAIKMGLEQLSTKVLSEH